MESRAGNTKLRKFRKSSEVLARSLILILSFGGWVSFREGGGGGQTDRWREVVRITAIS